MWLLSNISPDHKFSPAGVDWHRVTGRRARTSYAPASPHCSSRAAGLQLPLGLSAAGVIGLPPASVIGMRIGPPFGPPANVGPPSSVGPPPGYTLPGA